MRAWVPLRRVLLFFLVVGLGGNLLCAVDWPSFRGRNGLGVAETSELPVEFGPDTNVVWKTTLPTGKSSPVLTDRHIFLTAHEEGRLLTLCLDRSSGRILWRRSVERDRNERMHRLNSPASSTPATDGANVYAFFGDFGLVSYGADGQERWRKPLGPFTNLHGMSASPIVFDGKLILACDQDNDSYVMALDKDTGDTLWKTARPEVVHGFATPSMYQPAHGKPQVVVPGSYQMISYSAATGEKLWWVRGLTWQMKPTAVIEDETIYITGWAPGAEPAERKFFPPFEEAATEADTNKDEKLSPEELPEKWKPTGSWRAIDLDRDGFLSARDWSFYRARRSARNVTLAVRPGDARGDLTATHVRWEYTRSVPVVPSPVLYEGVLYIVKDGGIFTSLDPDTGAVLKTGRLRDAIDKYYASPVAANSKIYLVSETGKVTVVKPGNPWEVLQVNDLGEPGYATPAIGDRRLYVRTPTALYAFGSEK